MAVLPSPQSTHKFYQADGVTPAAAYEVYTYAAGTTTPLATYSDAAGVSANTFPIILNSNGEAQIYLTAGLAYDIVLKYPGGGAQVGATQRVIVDGDTAIRTDLSGSSGSSLVGFLQLGAGAVPRTSEGKSRDVVSVKDFGAQGIGIGANDAGAFNVAAAALVAAGGGRLTIPAGSYLLSGAAAPAVTIDAPNVAEPGTAVSIRGASAPSSVLISGVAGQYALKLIGGTATDAHGYECHADFSVMAGNPGANGIHLLNKALTGIENVTVQGCGTALKLESVLSSSFRNLTLGNNAVYGAHVLKGTGFSGCNANTFDSCNFRSNVVFGFVSEAFLTDTTFINCNFEANGRHGLASEGGCALEFNGAEGGVGATFTGGYFESNAGGADLFLTNTGSEYVTVVLTGVTFNRNVADAYVTNCIKTAGKVRLVTVGCAFRSYNGYTPNAGRKYIAGDASLIWEDYGSVMQDAIERPTQLSNSDRISFCGSVAGAGTALKLPLGWTCSKLATGSYRVTHNLGVASANDYAVTATTSGGSASFVLSLAKSTNVFDVSTVNPSFSGTDAQFDFTLTRL